MQKEKLKTLKVTMLVAFVLIATAATYTNMSKEDVSTSLDISNSSIEEKEDNSSSKTQHQQASL
ncbi:MAG: hypothetical protein MR031_00670 [Tenericutes bacterium]|mgnify:CR=1 FL=1|nr:hypothetical protein [Mycoplasmatota bacterium]